MFLFKLFVLFIIIENFTTCLGTFLCTSGSKLNFSKVCDGYPDCFDSSDETRKLCNGSV